jgi:hypothetical protein
VLTNCQLLDDALPRVGERPQVIAGSGSLIPVARWGQQAGVARKFSWRSAC